MTNKDRLFVHFASYISIITGLAYGYFKYFGKTQSKYGLIAHPLQSMSQHLHVLLVPLFVFAFGLIWNSHIKKKWKLSKTSKKITGYTILFTSILMTLTGYLIQAELTFNSTWVNLHIIISIAWIPFYLVHHFKKVAK